MLEKALQLYKKSQITEYELSIDPKMELNSYSFTH